MTKGYSSKSMKKLHDVSKFKSYAGMLVAFSIVATKFYAEASGSSSLDQLQNVIGKVIGIFLAASAIILVIIVGYGVIKGSLAAGDPRGLEGAKGTWTYAVYGFLIVVLAITIIAIIQGVLGIGGDANFGGFLDKVFDAIESLVSVSQSNIIGNQ